MIKIKKGILMTIIILFSCMTAINAEDGTLVSKSVLVYEILSIEVDQKFLIIKGWGLMNEVQHFINNKDHNYEIEFRAPDNNFKMNAEIVPLSQTNTMRFTGASRCQNNDLFKPGRNCYYDFENVGFIVKVELSKFSMDSSYTAYLLCNAKTAGYKTKIPIYYPIKEDIIKRNAEFEYRVVSKLDDTQLQINVTTVQARKEPNKSAAVWYSGPSCSNSYRNRLYFLENTTYYTIYDKTFNDNSSYYNVGASSAGCFEGRGRIKEGRDLNPVWIASNFVGYGGTPLQIKTAIKNTAPVLTILTNPIIGLGQELNPSLYISAWDEEEGNLTDKIQLVSSDLNLKKIGQYTLKYEVCDKYGSNDKKDMSVTVIGPKNKPPIIYAEDKTLKQHQKFDPLDQVIANDPEDGNITSKVKVLNQIDTALIGAHELCYYVEDSGKASHRKCILINVVEDLYRSRKIRFVDFELLFYNEEVPKDWQGLLNKLEAQLNNQKPHNEFNFIK